MDAEPITWALLAPTKPEKLEALAKEYWRDELGGSDRDYAEEGWEVMGGTSDHSAILDRNPGSEYTHDPQLAEHVSLKLPGKVYVLYLNERLADADSVAVYEAGEQTGQRSLPYDLARSLGIRLAGDDVDVEHDLRTAHKVKGVIVVEGVSAQDVARALDMNEPPRGPLHILDGEAGVIIYNDATKYTPPVTARLSKAFPESNVYTLGVGPREGRFYTRVTRAGDDVGLFELPARSPSDDVPALDSVNGATTPGDITAKLGLPAGLLDLP
jgi:hypothetical protein